MKISKKVREEAALICAIAASTRPALYCGEIAALLDFDNEAASAAARMSQFVANELDADPYAHETRAEAEALLRTGWTP